MQGNIMLIFVTIVHFKLIHVINKILHFVLQCNQDEIMNDEIMDGSQFILTIRQGLQFLW